MSSSSKRKSVPPSAQGGPARKKSAAEAGRVRKPSGPKVDLGTGPKKAQRPGDPAGGPKVPSAQALHEIVTSRQVGRVEALRYALTHPQRSREEQARLLREALRGSAQADAYLRFLVEELKPLIDQRYATRPDPDHTAIMGSSMVGGMFLPAVSSMGELGIVVAAHFLLVKPHLGRRFQLTRRNGNIRRTNVRGFFGKSRRCQEQQDQRWCDRKRLHGSPPWVWKMPTR